MKKILLIMFMMGVCLSLAQEKRTDESSAIIAETVINNGWVVAYGELLKRPYAITLRNDTIYINDMQVIPSLPNLYSPPIKPLERTELGEDFFSKQNSFGDRCGKLYAEWYNKYGEDKAGEMIITMLDTQQVIKIKEYKFYGNSIEIVYDYKWSDLYKEVTPVLQNSYYDEILNLYSWVISYKEKKTENEIKQEYQQNLKIGYNRIVKRLYYGSLLIYNFGAVVVYPSDKAEGVINNVREVLKSTLPDSLKTQAIANILSLMPNSTWEFIKNIDSWEVENEK